MTPGTSRTRNSTADRRDSTPRGRGPQGTRGRPGRASARRVAGRGRDRGGSRRARLGAAGLSDYMAEQNIARMEDDARTKIDALKLQRTPTTGSRRIASTAEDAAFAARRRLRQGDAALQTYLGKHPAAWKATNAEGRGTPRGERRDLCGGRGGARPVVRRWPAVVHSALAKAETTFSITTIKAAAKPAVGRSRRACRTSGASAGELFVPETAGTIGRRSRAWVGRPDDQRRDHDLRRLPGRHEAEARAFARSIYDHPRRRGRGGASPSRGRNDADDRLRRHDARPGLPGPSGNSRELDQRVLADAHPRGHLRTMVLSLSFRYRLTFGWIDRAVYDSLVTLWRSAVEDGATRPSRSRTPGRAPTGPGRARHRGLERQFEDRGSFSLC